MTLQLVQSEAQGASGGSEDPLSELDTPAGGGEPPSATPKRIVDLIVVTYWKQGRRIG